MANFATKAAQIDLEWPILVDLQLFPSFSTKVPQIDYEWPILPDLQLFQSFPPKQLKFTFNGQFYPIGNFILVNYKLMELVH